jgi:hypothetical protein
MHPVAGVVRLAIVVIVADVYLKITQFATWVAVDVPTAFKTLGMLAVVTCVYGYYLWNDRRRFLGLIAYLPCALLICAVPMLNYWSVEHIPGYVPPEYLDWTKWYGRWWWQLPLVFGIAGLGYALNKLVDDHH